MTTPIVDGGPVKSTLVSHALRTEMSKKLHKEGGGGNQSQTNNIVPINSTSLFAPLAANTIYFVHVVFDMSTSSPATPNIRIQFQGPADCDIHLRALGLDLDTVTYKIGFWDTPHPTTGLTGVEHFLVGGSGSAASFLEARGLIYMVTAGTVYCQWAQSTSSASSTSISGSSYFGVVRLGANPGISWT